MTKRSEQVDCMRAIDDALVVYASPSSALHREIRDELLRVRASLQFIAQTYSERRAAREAADRAWEQRASAAAAQGLEEQLRLHEKNKALGSPELTAMSEDSLMFAKLRVEQVKKQSAWLQAMTEFANSMDAGLQTWVENLTTLSVRALFDDAALERALAFASATTIVAGLDGGTLAIMAAAAAAALLARDVWKNATRKGRASRRDKDLAREEAAKKLLEAARRVASDWQAILSSSAATRKTGEFSA